MESEFHNKLKHYLVDIDKSIQKYVFELINKDMQEHEISLNKNKKEI